MPSKGHFSLKRKKGFHIYALVLSDYPTDSQDQIHDRVWSGREKWKKEFNWEAPEASSTSKGYIKAIRDAQSRKWLDNPWHTGIFAVNDSYELEFSTDQLPVVMQTAMRAFAGGKRLTTRQAMWVARLNALIHLDPEQATDIEITNIYGLAVAYSAREMAVAAIAYVFNPGQSVLPSGHESVADTWPLDVIVALTESVTAPAWTLYEVLIEAEYTAEPIWPTGPGVRMGITPTSDEVKTLYVQLLKVVPELVGSCEATTRALLWFRAYAEQQTEFVAKSGESAVDFIDVSPSGVSYPPITNPVQFWEAARDAPIWESLSLDEQEDKAREIGNRVMKEINTEKCKAERVQAEQQTANAREIALQVMELIERQKAEKQKETGRDN